MRSLLFATVASLLAGCIPFTPTDRVQVEGTVSYTSTPPNQGASGALPLHMLYCFEPPPDLSAPKNELYAPRPDTYRHVIELGDSCTFSSIGDAPLRAVGVCSIKMSEGDVPIDVQSIAATPRFVFVGKFAHHRNAFEVVLGGKTPDGRYVTYRFSEGGAEREATAEECQAALNRRP